MRSSNHHNIYETILSNIIKRPIPDISRCYPSWNQLTRSPEQTIRAVRKDIVNTHGIRRGGKRENNIVQVITLMFSKQWRTPLDWCVHAEARNYSLDSLGRGRIVLDCWNDPDSPIPGLSESLRNFFSASVPRLWAPVSGLSVYRQGALFPLVCYYKKRKTAGTVL